MVHGKCHSHKKVSVSAAVAIAGHWLYKFRELLESTLFGEKKSGMDLCRNPGFESQLYL